MSWETALAVREKIRACTACPLRQTATAPVPWSGKTPAQIAILGMAPGYQEDKMGFPFVGPSGYLLRDFLKRAGINASLAAFFNPVCCYPGKTKRRKGDKEPTASELEACQSNLLDQIDIIQPRYIILCGKVALRAFRPDLTLSHLVGKPMFYTGRDGFGRSVEWGDRHVTLWVTYHPAAALRNKQYEASIREHLAAFREFRTNERWPGVCYTCGKEVDTYDSWGVGRCELHDQSSHQPTLFGAR